MLTRDEIINALKRLGQLAQEQGQTIEVLIVGGAALMLGDLQTRLSTHDVDAVILAPNRVQWVKELVHQVAIEQALVDNWLNDAAKGYLVGRSQPAILFEALGIVVLAPATAGNEALGLAR